MYCTIPKQPLVAHTFHLLNVTVRQTVDTQFFIIVIQKAAQDKICKIIKITTI